MFKGGILLFGIPIDGAFHEIAARYWELIVASFTDRGALSKRDAELGILNLVGLVRIEPNLIGPTAFVLTIPKDIPDEVLSNVEE